MLYSNRRLIQFIRASGWFGIGLTALAIALQNTQIFLTAQLVASATAMAYAIFLQGKLTIDLIIVLVLGIISVFSTNQWFFYSAILVRGISYQLVFGRMVKNNPTPPK